MGNGNHMIDDDINYLIQKAIARYNGIPIENMEATEFPDTIYDIKQLFEHKEDTEEE